MKDKVSLAEIALPNRLAFLRNASKFRQTFGKPLKDFWQGNILGLDVITFDVFIAPESGESTMDAIIRKYGQEGWSIVADLLIR